MHIVARFLEGIGSPSLDIIHVIGAEDFSLRIRDGIAVAGVLAVEPVLAAVLLLRLGLKHILRAAAQHFAGIVQSQFTGLQGRIPPHLLRQILVHGLVVQVHGGQADDSRSAADGAHQAQGAQGDGDKFECQIVSHLPTPSIL